jgi:hypothetical protein
VVLAPADTFEDKRILSRNRCPLPPGVKIHVTVGGFDPLDVTDRHDRSGISTSNPGIAVAAQGEALPAAIFYGGGDLLNRALTDGK